MLFSMKCYAHTIFVIFHLALQKLWPLFQYMWLSTAFMLTNMECFASSIWVTFHIVLSELWPFVYVC